MSELVLAALLCGEPNPGRFSDAVDVAGFMVRGDAADQVRVSTRRGITPVQTVQVLMECAAYSALVATRLTAVGVRAELGADGAVTVLAALPYERYRVLRQDGVVPDRPEALDACVVSLPTLRSVRDLLERAR